MDIYVPFNHSDKMRDLYIELEDMFTWFFEDKKRGLVSIDELRQKVRGELYPED